MRKQTRFLKDIADPPQVSRPADALADIDEGRAIQMNRSARGCQHARDQIEQRGLARSRRSDERRQSRPDLHPHVERKLARGVRRFDPEAHDGFRLSFRPRISDAISAMTEMPTESQASLVAAISPPGRSSSVKTASASVRVSPGMFETNVIVAPNSPSALAKPMMSPASSPGNASGSVTVRNTQNGLAPSVPADSSIRRSTFSMPSRIARTTSGNDMTPAASAAPVQRNENCRPR